MLLLNIACTDFSLDLTIIQIRTDTYNKSQILISHVLAFHVALRTSPRCSSIILKRLSGKGWHVVNLGRSFSFDRYIFVVASYCRDLYSLQATSQVSPLVLGSDKGRVYGAVIQSSPGGEMQRTGSSSGWGRLDGWGNPYPYSLNKSNAGVQCSELLFFSVCISPEVSRWTKANLMAGCFSPCCLATCSYHLSCLTSSTGSGMSQLSLPFSRISF